MNYETSNPSQTAAQGRTVVRAFWWGFHVEISHPDLQQIVNSPDPISVAQRLIRSGNIPGAVVPFIGAVISFIVGNALKLLQGLDQGRGVYISMSWFAPGVFVPTTV